MAIKSIIKDNAEIVGLEITQELIEKLEIYAKELKELTIGLLNREY